MAQLQIYSAINAISKDLQEGIKKEFPEKRNSGAPDYAFRSIDQVYNYLNPCLVNHQVIIVPKYSNREVSERRSKNNAALFYTTLTGTFDFISAVDGSMVTVTTIGEAMDSGDKSTNKAMAVAFKYACLQTFCIPTEDMSDPDKETHEIVPLSQPGENVTSNPNQGVKQKVKLRRNTPAWERAIQSVKDTGSLDAVEKHCDIDPEDQTYLLSFCKGLTQTPDDEEYF